MSVWSKAVGCVGAWAGEIAVAAGWSEGRVDMVILSGTFESRSLLDVVGSTYTSIHNAVRSTD